MSGLLSENKWYILNFVLGLDRRIEALKCELKKMPEGNIYKRKCGERTVYRYVVYVKGKQTERILKETELANIHKKICRRNEIEEDLRIIKNTIDVNIKQFMNCLKSADEIINRYYKESHAVIKNNTYKPEGLNMVSVSGIKVRSKSEMLLINLFEAHHLNYEYEHELKLNGFSNMWHPDFWLIEPLSGKTIVWEHAGMRTKQYELYLENKLNAYKENGIVEGKNLIITKDEKDGSLNLIEIEEILNRVFFLKEYKALAEKYVRHKSKPE